MPLPVVRTVLANGLTVLVRTDRSAPVVAIVTRVDAGYFDETDDEVGISHALEHMYFKGTPTRGVGEIAKETKASGGYLNAHTIYDGTTYEAILPSAAFVRGLEIQADAYANSLIDADELARELEVIIQEVKRKRDNPPAMAMESLFALLHDRHRFRRWRMGEEEGLRALTRERMLAFYRNFYRPRNTILAIVGDVDADAALAEAERRFGRLPDEPVRRKPGDVEIEPAGFRFREFGGDVEQAQVVLGWRTPGPLDEDTAALDVAAGILGDGRGSRLYRAVRERQLATTVTAMNYTPRDTGVFVIRVEGDAARAADAAAAVWRAVGDARDRGVAPAELLRAQRMFEARWLRRLESMEGQADHLVEWEGLGDWAMADRYFDRVMALTAGDVQAAMARHLDAGQASMLVYRPRAQPVLDGASAGDVRARLEVGSYGPTEVAAALGAPVIPGAAAVVEMERRVGPIAVLRAASGLPILVRRRVGAPLVHLGFFTGDGAAIEPDAVAGIGTIMARATVKGTGSLDAAAIANASELLGGSIGTGVTADGMAWSISVPTPRYAEAIALLQEVVQRPVFPDDAVETERAIAMSQLVQLRDDMYRYPLRLANAAAYGPHPYGRALLGTEESLRAVTATAVRDWHGQHLLTSPAVVAAIGDVDEAELARALASAFASVQPAPTHVVPTPAWPTGISERLESRDKAQSAVAIGFPGARRADPERFILEILSGIAGGQGGRFFSEIREKRGLAYTVHAVSLERASAGMFVAYVATGPEREEEARAALLDECERLRREPVSEEELDRAKHHAVGSYAIARQGASFVLGEMVNAWLHGEGLGEIEETEPRLSAVTAESIQAYAQRALDPARRVEGVVRGRASAKGNA